MRKAQAESVVWKKLVDAAREQMLTRGYTATSVDDICTAAGVTKGSFFHYFTDKEHLGRVVAERFYADRVALFEKAPLQDRTDPLDRVLAIIDFFVQVARSPQGVKGCLLGTFVQELSKSHPKIRDVCASCFDDQADRFKAALDEAKAKYAPGAKWKSESVASHLIAVLQGGIILAKARQDRGAVAESLGHFREYVRHLFEQ
jgi:TetR/AcrR family transcriptional regulator, transcriptional repressor for nem operon